MFCTTSKSSLRVHIFTGWSQSEMADLNLICTNTFFKEAWSERHPRTVKLNLKRPEDYYSQSKMYWSGMIGHQSMSWRSQIEWQNIFVIFIVITRGIISIHKIYWIISKKCSKLKHKTISLIKHLYHCWYQHLRLILFLTFKPEWKLLRKQVWAKHHFGSVLWISST